MLVICIKILKIQPTDLKEPSLNKCTVPALCLCAFTCTTRKKFKSLQNRKTDTEVGIRETFL